MVSAGEGTDGLQWCAGGNVLLELKREQGSDVASLLHADENGISAAA